MEIMKFVKALFLLLAFIPFRLVAMDISIEQSFTNNYLGDTRDILNKNFITDDYNWGSNVQIKDIVNDKIYFIGGYTNSRIQKQNIFSLLQFDTEFLEFSFGPRMGIFNTEKIPFNPGLTAKAGFVVPGVFFLRGGFDTSLSPVAQEGDYYTQGLTLSSGVFIPNGIITARILKEQGVFELSGYIMENSLSSYLLSTEVFYKNFPLRFTVHFDYQIYNKRYSPGLNLELHSLLGGLKTNIVLNSDFQFFVKGEGSILSFGLKDLNKSGNSGDSLFSFSIGLEYVLNTSNQTLDWTPPIDLDLLELLDPPEPTDPLEPTVEPTEKPDSIPEILEDPVVEPAPELN